MWLGCPSCVFVWCVSSGLRNITRCDWTIEVPPGFNRRCSVSTGKDDGKDTTRHVKLTYEGHFKKQPLFTKVLYELAKPKHCMRICPWKRTCKACVGPATKACLRCTVSGNVQIEQVGSLSHYAWSLKAYGIVCLKWKFWEILVTFFKPHNHSVTILGEIFL